MSSDGRSVWGALGAFALAALAPLAALAEPPRVWVADEASRIRQHEVGSPLADGFAAWRPGSPIRLAALREEVVAFQVIVESRGDAASGVVVRLGPWSRAGAASPLAASLFLEHYVEVRARSRNDRRPAESLGWSPQARPADEIALGWVPDALIPIEWATDWAPHPMSVPGGTTRAVWVDVLVPAGAEAGQHTAELTVDSGSHGRLATIPVVIDVRAATLPYRAVSAFAAYDSERSLHRTGDHDSAERSVWQVLHAHHVDAVGDMLSPADARRLGPAIDGSLFTAAHGYVGPGVGAPPELVPIGLYGQLRDPTEAKVADVAAIVEALPRTDAFLFVYAIDEQCDSPRGPRWRALLRASSMSGRVSAGHTCHRDPRTQDVDLVMMPSDTFEQAPAVEARQRGQSVWVYNGSLPRSGPMHIDAHYTSLLANGWIAATRPVERWFYWEATFWHDSNRGGRGPIDPFVVAESFHNADGDAGLFDGLLVYPGAQPAPWLSLGKPGTVVPSMRLKLLRRGIQDAGYLALARAAAPREADAIAARLVPSALDELPRTVGVPWPTDAAAWTAARDELRALIPDGGHALDGRRARRVLATSASVTPSTNGWRGVVVAGVFAVVAVALAARMARRAARV